MQKNYLFEQNSFLVFRHSAELVRENIQKNTFTLSTFAIAHAQQRVKYLTTFVFDFSPQDVQCTVVDLACTVYIVRTY